MTVFGQAVLFASLRVAIYWCVASLFFHCVVVFVEEPHLRATRGGSLEAYLRRVPRWLGRG
jgi:protein-S-isoprenylcysteine O-methyltransferase Ste14